MDTAIQREFADFYAHQHGQKAPTPLWEISTNDLG